MTDAIIVNWNGREDLLHCLEALGRSVEPVRIIVVDNASTDGSVEYLETEHPDVEVIALDQNIGYAAGANAGLRRGSAPYAIILNPDVALAPDHLEQLVAKLEADPSIGVAQGKLYRGSRDDFASGTLTAGGILDSAGHVIRRTRMVHDRGQGKPEDPGFSFEASIFSACGAALFLRRAMLEDLAYDDEYFDNAFFAYKEDIDLCWRARLLGWDVRYIPDAVGWHVRSWEGGRMPRKDRIPAEARRHSWKNHYLLMLKNDRWTDMLRSLPAILGWEIMRQMYAVLRDPGLYQTYLPLIRDMPGVFRKRRSIMGRRRISPGAMRRWFGGDPVLATDENSSKMGVLQ